MDQRAGGRGTGHGVRQPGLQGKLRGLPHRAAQQQERSRCRVNRPCGPLLGRTVHQGLNIERAQLMKQQKEAEDHRRIADARDDKSLASRAAIRRIRVPKTNQQITAEAHAFPAEIKQQKIVAKQQRYHRGDKEIHVTEEPAVAFIVDHELGGIEVNDEADERHDKRHQHGERIEIEANLRMESVDAHPGPENLRVGIACGRRGEKTPSDENGDQSGKADRAHTNHRATTLRPIRGPTIASTNAPAKGTAGISQTNSSNLASHLAGGVRIEGLPLAVQLQ